MIDPLKCLINEATEWKLDGATATVLIGHEGIRLELRFEHDGKIHAAQNTCSFHELRQTYLGVDAVIKRRCHDLARSLWATAGLGAAA